MSLQGNLENLPLIDLLPIVTRREQSGALQLTNLEGIPTLAATVLIQGGNLYTAWIYQKKDKDNLVQTLYTGETALQLLLVCPQANFIFKILTSDYTFPERNVFGTVNELLLANIFQAENLQAVWNEILTDWEIVQASQIPANRVAQPMQFRQVESTFKVHQTVEITNRTTSFNTNPANGAGVTSHPLQLAAPETARLQTVSNTMPKTSRGWLSSLMTKIRSL